MIGIAKIADNTTSIKSVTAMSAVPVNNSLRATGSWSRVESHCRPLNTRAPHKAARIILTSRLFLLVTLLEV